MSLRDHDERVELDGWTYYVRGVRRESELLPRRAVTADLLMELPVLAYRGVKWLATRNRPWTVAVVRLGSVQTWNDVRPEVVHREVLPPGQAPGGRIGELVEQVESGRYAPTQ